MDPRATGTAARLSDSLCTPWSGLRSTPGLPVQCLDAVDASVALPAAVSRTAPLRLDVPWTGAEIVHPARADALPVAATVPMPRATIDLRDPVAPPVPSRR